jgi:hypothetical protein
LAAPHSRSTILIRGNALIQQGKFSPRAIEHCAPDPSEIYALEFKGKLDDSATAWFQRLSASIGRVSTLLGCASAICLTGKRPSWTAKT